MRIKTIVLGLVMVMLVMGISAGCAKDPKPSDTSSSTVYKNIVPDQLEPILDEKDLFLVDVHIPEQKHIPGTDLVVPYNEIEKNIDKFPSDKNARIVLYCRSGGMSAEAARKLIELGYTNIFNLAGGVGAWTSAGYPVEQ